MGWRPGERDKIAFAEQTDFAQIVEIFGDSAYLNHFIKKASAKTPVSFTKHPT